MRLQSFQFKPSTGWSVDAFPALDSPDTLVLVFGSRHFDADCPALSDLRAAYPKAHVLGCSTAGEIHGSGVYDGTLSVAVMQLEKSTLRSATIPVDDAADSFDVGERLAAQMADPALRGLFVLSDGLRVNGSQLVKGIASSLPPDVPVTGGLAGDGARFESTWVSHGASHRNGVVVGLGLYGEHVRFGHGSMGGWDIFGLERRVTKSVGNVLFELDGRPALDLYKEYLGERASGLPATALLFPLSVRMDANDTHPVVRTILGVDESARSMTFAGDVPEGALAQLMRANFDRLVDGAQGAAQMITAQARGDVLAIAISCVGRRLILGERIEEEVEATLAALPKGTQQVGFYSYGEISPYATGTCELHNQTMTLTTISES